MTWALGSLKNFHFNNLLLSKAYIVWAKKVQRSYLSWHWRVIQKLKKSWLVLKLTWWTSEILTQTVESLKNLYFNWLLVTKYILFELQKYRWVIFHDTEEICKFWRKTDLRLEKRLGKFGKLSPEHFVKVGTLMGSFCPK